MWSTAVTLVICIPISRWNICSSQLAAHHRHSHSNCILPTVLSSALRLGKEMSFAHAWNIGTSYILVRSQTVVNKSAYSGHAMSFTKIAHAVTSMSTNPTVEEEEMYLKKLCNKRCIMNITNWTCWRLTGYKRGRRLSILAPSILEQRGGLESCSTLVFHEYLSCPSAFSIALRHILRTI